MDMTKSGLIGVCGPAGRYSGKKELAARLGIG